jgi:hypothetical protein
MAAALSTGSLRATDDFAQGDLALVFYSVSNPAPGSFGTEYYVFNLGPASSFRENTQNNVSVKTVNPTISNANIAADLSSVFGPGWADDGTVRMMVVGTIQGGQSANGDTSRTIYFSAARTSLNSGQTGYDAMTPFTYVQGNAGGNTLSSSVRAAINNNLTTFLYTSTNGAITAGNVTSGANISGTRITTSVFTPLSTFVPPSQPNYFQTLENPTVILRPGTLPGTANVEAAVDVFRILNNLTTNAPDLTSGSSSGDAVVGQGQYIGAITLDTAGNLKVQAVGASAPAANFASWAAENNVTGGPQGDSDLDGISNLLEYALNLNLTGSDGSPGTVSGRTTTFTKRAVAVTNNDITYAIEESDDLGISDAWAVVTPTTNTTSEISYTLPLGSPKKFARLVVTQVP